MTNDQIKEVAIANGHPFFTNPDGTEDIHPLAYQFARALFAEQQRLWDKERADIEFHEDWLESD
ncbi:hypothetical protein [Psychrobacter celer]|uniref:hypothetical protein n=1 Tax=Psychrobacter celer TaxID=306572 RepID=UPI003FD253B2